MAYEVQVGRKAADQIQVLDAAVGSSIERKIAWLAENARHIVAFRADRVVYPRGQG